MKRPVLFVAFDEFDAETTATALGQPFVVDLNKLKLPKGATGVPPGARPLAVSFVAEDGTQFQAVVNPDTGTFELPGADGKGIRPGRYKVAITCGVGGRHGRKVDDLHSRR